MSQTSPERCGFPVRAGAALAAISLDPITSINTPSGR
jgi:hypothetical protein